MTSKFISSCLLGIVWISAPSVAAERFQVRLEDEAILTEFDVASAKSTFDQRSKRYGVLLKLSPYGTDVLRTATAENSGKRISMHLDGKQIVAFMAKDVIENGSIAFPPKYSSKEANQIASSLEVMKQAAVLESDVGFHFFGNHKGYTLRTVRFGEGGLPKKSVMDSISVSLSKGQRFAFDDEVYCKSEGRSVPAVVSSKDSKERKSAYQPLKAWKIETETGKIGDLDPKRVTCENRFTI